MTKQNSKVSFRSPAGNNKVPWMPSQLHSSIFANSFTKVRPAITRTNVIVEMSKEFKCRTMHFKTACLLLNVVMTHHLKCCSFNFESCPVFTAIHGAQRNCTTLGPLDRITRSFPCAANSNFKLKLMLASLCSVKIGDSRGTHDRIRHMFAHHFLNAFKTHMDPDSLLPVPGLEDAGSKEGTTKPASIKWVDF